MTNQTIRGATAGADPSARRSAVEELASFAAQARWEDISYQAREQLKLRVLDAIGVAIGALDGEPVRMVRSLLSELGGAPLASLIGGGSASPDNAALYNGTLVRYLDFNDSYLAPGETCHPSDSLAAVLAASEYSKASGRDLLTALAVAYQVQCRLSDLAPVRARGFDHVTHGAYAAAAGAARALRLDAAATANAVAIAGTSLNALRVTRTGQLSHWKGLAAPWAASNALKATLLAKQGITGPREVFEGNKGFIDALSGPFELDWTKEGLEIVRRTILKRYNAEIHSQSAIEALLELRSEHRLKASEVQQVELRTFQVAYDIIGGGEEGEKHTIATKEQADHSLPYLLAVALLDGTVLPQQYDPARIVAEDVQQLLRRVTVAPDDELSRRFPDEHSALVHVHMRDGRVLEREKHDYHGFHTNPMDWNAARAKFDRLATPRIGSDRAEHIAETIRHLDEPTAADLTAALHFEQKEQR